MATPGWLDEVRGELRRAGLPARYRARLLDELQDHVQEMLHEGSDSMSTETLSSEVLEGRLGSAAQIAAAAKEQVPAASFARRHPVWTFLVLPAPALLLLWIGYLAATIGVLSLLKSQVGQPWAEPVAGILIHGIAYIPPVVIAGLLVWIAIRRECPRGWLVTGTAVVALLAGLLSVSFRMPTRPGNGMLTVGFGFPPPIAQWPQFLVPAMVATLLAVLLIRLRSKATPSW